MHLRPKRQLVKGEHCSVLSGSSRHVHVCAAQVGQCLQCTGKGTASVSAAMENSGHDSPRQCTRSKFGETELADFHTSPHTHTHTLDSHRVSDMQCSQKERLNAVMRGQLKASDIMWQHEPRVRQKGCVLKIGSAFSWEFSI